MAKERNQTVQDILTEITEIKQKRAAQIAEHNARIAELKAKKGEAARDAAEAFDKADVNAYHAAQDAQRAADDGIEMFKNRIDRSAKTPLISADEGAKMEAVVRGEVNDFLSVAWAELESMGGRCKELLKQLDATFRPANEALHAIQHDLLLDDCMVPAGESGKFYYNRQLEKRCDGYDSLRHAITAITDAIKNSNPYARQ